MAEMDYTASEEARLIREASLAIYKVREKLKESIGFDPDSGYAASLAMVHLENWVRFQFKHGILPKPVTEG